MPSRPAKPLITTTALYLPKELLEPIEQAFQDWLRHNMSQRLWAKDSTLWTGEDEARWMGWVEEAQLPSATRDVLVQFQKEVFQRNFTDIVVMGMGGSSLGPYVLDQLLPKADGYGQLHVLDSTDPYTLQQLTSQLDPHKTLFIVASKSGGTLETTSFLDYFYRWAQKQLGKSAAQHFVVITDPYTSLESFGRAEGFWKIFHGHPETGGRFSIFSFFGLIPACAAGLNLPRLEAQLHSAYERAGPQSHSEMNPAIMLGVLVGTLAQRSVLSELVLCAPTSLEPLMQWIEQIIAESTGKDGKGLLPLMPTSPTLDANSYTHPIFIFFAHHQADVKRYDQQAQALYERGYPAVIIKVPQLEQSVQQCFYWEIATAIIGHFLGINPFNQPDVQSTKTAILRLIKQAQQEGLPACEPVHYREGHLTLSTPSETPPLAKNAQALLAQFLGSHEKHVYLALLNYVPDTPATRHALRKLKTCLETIQPCPTSCCFGPRYLHSTGQFFKGGAPLGRFLVITYEAPYKVPIPHHALDFSTLEKLQGLGDLLTLHQKGRPVLHLHIHGCVEDGIDHLIQLIERIVPAYKREKTP